MKTTILTFAIALLATVPALSATSKAACSVPDKPASADRVFYDMPAIAAQLGMSGTSVVKIDLNANGEMTSQTLFTSSGVTALDEAAMRSARLTRFTAELRDCKSVPGSYLYAVDFSLP